MVEKQIKFKKNLIFKRIIFLIMLIATFYIIFNFSAQDGETSGTISMKVTEFIVKIISKVKNMDMALRLHYIERLHPYVRKLAHFSIYTLVGFSIMGFMCTFNIRNVFKLIISIFTGVGYAVSDEIHQSFTPGRTPRLLDIGIDSLGVLTGIFILIFLIILAESFINWLKK